MTTKIEVVYKTATTHFVKFVVNSDEENPKTVLDSDESRKFINILEYPFDLIADIESELNANNILLVPENWDDRYYTEAEVDAMF